RRGRARDRGCRRAPGLPGARAPVRQRLPGRGSGLGPGGDRGPRPRSSLRGAVMRMLELPRDASPRDWGRIHGERFRGEIRSLTEIRMYLTLRLGRFPDADTVLRVAAAHLPVLERYDR